MTQLHEDVYFEKTDRYITAVAKNVYEQGVMNRLAARAILFPDSIKSRSF